VQLHNRTTANRRVEFNHTGTCHSVNAAQSYGVGDIVDEAVADNSATNKGGNKVTVTVVYELYQGLNTFSKRVFLT